jgi:hypothetical protein
MTKTIVLILMRTRRQSAVRVQKVLTDFGCMIKTRLGIHDGVLDRCSDVGLVVLEVVGPKQERQKLRRALSAVAGVTVKLVDISL